MAVELVHVLPSAGLNPRGGYAEVIDRPDRERVTITYTTPDGKCTVSNLTIGVEHTEPVTGRARTTDPATSHEAAPPPLRIRDDHQIVLDALVILGASTDFEIAHHAGRSQTSLGKRRGELRDAGLVEATSIRRPAPSGKPSTVWALTDAGRAAARRSA